MSGECVMDKASVVDARRHLMPMLHGAGGRDIESQPRAATTLQPCMPLRGLEAALRTDAGLFAESEPDLTSERMTVTRCARRDSEGRLGHAMVAGCDMTQAGAVEALALDYGGASLIDTTFLGVDPGSPTVPHAIALMTGNRARRPVLFQCRRTPPGRRRRLCECIGCAKLGAVCAVSPDWMARC